MFFVQSIPIIVVGDVVGNVLGDVVGEALGDIVGDVLGDLEHPTHHTLHAAMTMIQQQGCGALVYLRHEKMGSGLVQRLQTMHLPHGSDHDADRPAIAADKGDYGIGSQILRDMGVRKLRLITNHPFTPTALSGFGLEITEFVPVPLAASHHG